MSNNKLAALRIALEDLDSTETLGPTTEAVIAAAQNWYLSNAHEAEKQAGPVAIQASAPVAAIPAGWSIERHDDGGFVVRAPDGSGAYAHADDIKLSIAANVLAMLAEALSQGPAVAQAAPPSESAPVEQAGPVAFVSSVQTGSPLMCGLSERDQRCLVPLYAAPPSESDKEDAERYRFLRDALTWTADEATEHPPGFDAAFDPIPKPFGTTWSVDFTVEGYGLHESEDSLDAAIDVLRAARAKKDPQ